MSNRARHHQEDYRDLSGPDSNGPAGQCEKPAPRCAEIPLAQAMKCFLCGCLDLQTDWNGRISIPGTGRWGSMTCHIQFPQNGTQSEKELKVLNSAGMFLAMSGRQRRRVFLLRNFSSSGIACLLLGIFLFATQAKLSKYSANDGSKTSTFKSTTCTENRSDPMVEFEVVSFARPSINMDSSQRNFEQLTEPVCKIRTLFLPYPFRPPPA